MCCDVLALPVKTYFLTEVTLQVKETKKLKRYIVVRELYPIILADLSDVTTIT